MKIWWCQEHEAPIWFSDTTICSFAKYGPGYDPAPCRMIPMRLIPDNAETVDTKALLEAVRLVKAFGGAAEVNAVVAAASVVIGTVLDGETP